MTEALHLFPVCYPPQKILKLAQSAHTVLITGETGTGKEMAARSLHELSGRTGPFIPKNCTAIPVDLLESELFGHVRGAFTGAVFARKGLFASANKGTLLLDEIGDVPLSTQAKLLRVLEEGHLTPLGGDNALPFDARVIAATNRDLQQEVEEGRFREDLFYRLNHMEIQIPPLRATPWRVEPLAQHFIKATIGEDDQMLTLSQQSIDFLLAYDWPGNVRELKSWIERAVILCEKDEIEPGDFFLRDDGAEVVQKGLEGRALTVIKALLKAGYKREGVYSLIAEAAYQLSGGSMTAAGELLDLSRSNAHAFIKKRIVLNSSEPPESPEP